MVLVLGQAPPGIFIALGLGFTPRLPWFLATTAIWLVVFWFYLDGRWWPVSTSAVRHELLRSRPLSQKMWICSLLCGGLGMVSVLSGALLTGLVADLPQAAYQPPVDLSPYPWWTTLAVFLNLALVAGVVEEAAFRGYMLSLVERRHGWAVGILSVAIAFYVVHLSHAYATVAFIPFFAAYSLLHGLLVYFARSVLPSVVLHVLGDSAILPMQYGVVPNPLGTSVPAHILAVGGFGIAAGFTMWRLATVSRDLREESLERRTAP